MKIQDTSSLCMASDKYHNEIGEFINICSSVFPASIEVPYVELANHFLDYSSSSRKLIKCGYDLDTNVTGMNGLRNSVDELSNSERHVLESFRKLFDYYKDEERLPFEIWKTFQDMVTSGVEISSERESKEFSLKTDTRKYMDDSVDASKQQEQIKESVVGMQKDLDTIQALDMDGQRRIDRVEVTQKHFDRIDAIPNISSEQKDILKSMLVSYVGMRVESFKAMENFAHKALDAWQQRRIYGDGPSYEYDVAIFALSDLTTSFSKDLYETIQDFRLYESTERLQADIAAMNMFRDYQKNGMIDSDLLSRLLKTSDLHTETYNALSCLSYFTEKQNYELLQNRSSTTVGSRSRFK